MREQVTTPLAVTLAMDATGDLGGPPRLARWRDERRAERERVAALAAAGVTDAVAYEEPGLQEAEVGVKCIRGRNLIVLRPPHNYSTQTQRIWGFLGTLNQMVIVTQADCQALIGFVSESVTYWNFQLVLLSPKCSPWST